MGKNAKELRWLIYKSRAIYINVILLSIINILSSVLGVGFAVVSKELIDIATGKRTAHVLSKSLFLILFIMVQLALKSLIIYLNARAQNRLEMKLKNDLFKSVFKKDWILISKYHSADLVNRLSKDVSIVSNSLISFIPQFLALSSNILAAFYVLVKLDFLFALIILFISPLFLICGRIYGRIIKRFHLKSQENDSKIKSFIQEAIQNIIAVKTFDNHELIAKKLKAFQAENYKFQMKRSGFAVISNGGMYLGFWIIYCFTIIWGALRISTGFITFGTFTAFMQLSSQIHGPFMSITSMISSIYTSLASAGRLIEIENIPYEEGLENESIKDFNEIVFSNVYYKYDKDEVLKDVSFNIKKGEFAVISGDSGNGKTTLLRLLLGLIKPSCGNISISYDNDKMLLIDNKLRSLFAYVPQGNIIFSGTIRENICFANPNADDSEMEFAAKCACIWEFISELPDKLNTIIGERGLGLSEGQVQRIAIARAILYKAPILILDEATSAIDEKTEIEILKNIKGLEHLWALIIVTHRKTAFDFSDKIINIKDGNVNYL